MSFRYGNKTFQNWVDLFDAANVSVSANISQVDYDETPPPLMAGHVLPADSQRAERTHKVTGVHGYNDWDFNNRNTRVSAR